MSAGRIPGTLLAITPGTLTQRELPAFARTVARAVAAGLDSVLVREPELGDRATLELARALREVLGPEKWLGVHDRVHLAQACGADAVHLGWRSLSLAEARGLVPKHVGIGLSAHAHDDRKAWLGADYFLFGPVRDTPSKRGKLEPTGFDGLAHAARSTSIPTWAVGGLHPEHARETFASGARGLAAIGALLGSPDPAAATRAWLAALPMTGPR